MPHRHPRLRVSQAARVEAAKAAELRALLEAQEAEARRLRDLAEAAKQRVLDQKQQTSSLHKQLAKTTFCAENELQHEHKVGDIVEAQARCKGGELKWMRGRCRAAWRGRVRFGWVLAAEDRGARSEEGCLRHCRASASDAALSRLGWRACPSPQEL